MKNLFIVFFLLISHMLMGQIKNTIGFYCGYNGDPSSTIVMMDNLVKKSNFKLIRKKLFDPDNPTKCLAVIVCEILEKKGEIKMTKIEKDEIKNAYRSERKIIIIYGCAYKKQTTMKNILNEIDCNKSGDYFKRMAIKRYK